MIPTIVGITAHLMLHLGIRISACSYKTVSRELPELDLLPNSQRKRWTGRVIFIGDVHSSRGSLTSNGRVINTTLLSCTTHMQLTSFDIRVRRFRLWKLPELFVAVLVTLKVAYSEGQGVHLAFPEGFNGGLPICDRCVVVPALARHLGGH